MNQKKTTFDDLQNHMRNQYAGVAQGGLSNDSSSVRSIAASFGYSNDDLNQLPAEANMGLSCGNPLALAGLSEGEVVVDLGCGGGMDVFLAANKVGETGRVIGIDMTAEMLVRARAGKEKLGRSNVEFHQSTIDRLPLPDNSVDCVISNCVINLVPNKLAVFHEILRVLKPGGRVALSDIALKQELPTAIKQNLEAYVGCISGAILISEYRNLLEQAGFDTVVVTDTGADLNVYAAASDGAGCCGSVVVNGSGSGSGCCDPGLDLDINSDSAVDQNTNPTSTQSLHDNLASIMQSFDANAFAASVRVHALKQPAAGLENLTESNAIPDSFPSQTNTSNLSTKPQEKMMKTVQIYDKPLCCSTGICGPDVDPVLPRFAADLDWLKGQGHQVDRYNLAQQPQAFVANKMIQELLRAEGVECLPVVVVDGAIVSRAVYPTREMLADWTNGTEAGVTCYNDSQPNQSLPTSQADQGCCG